MPFSDVASGAHTLIVDLVSSQTEEAHFDLTLPDGTTMSLIHIARWDLNWQAVYRYAEPMLLPKGTTISMRFTYDNSAENIRNPNHPPQRVVAGNRASDEMAHLWLQVLPRDSAQAGVDPRARRRRR